MVHFFLSPSKCPYSSICQGYPSSGHLHLEYKLCTKYDDHRSVGSPDILNRGIIQPNTHKILRNVNQVFRIRCSNSMFDIMILAQADLHLFCCQDCFALLYKMPNSKREIIRPNIYRIRPHVNLVSYIMDTICEPDIRKLAQAVLQIFCWQCSIWLQCISWKRAMIQSNIYRNLLNVNQVTFTLDTICVSNIMILSQAVHQIYSWKGSSGL